MAGKTKPRNAYHDPAEGSQTYAVLEMLKTRGLTVAEAVAMGKVPEGTRLSGICVYLRDMCGYDVRTVKVPQGHRRSTGKRRRNVVYFVAGRWDWDHTEYESFVDGERLLMEED